MKWCLFIFLASIFYFPIEAQTISNQIGFSVQLGTHNRKVSIWTRPQLLYKGTQIYNVVELSFYQRGLGSKKSYLQGLVQFGVAQGFGKDFTENYLPIKWTTWQNTKEFQVGYQLNFYLDSRKTSQRTATILMQYRKFQMISENDAFAFSPKDRFRTGSLELMYLDSNFAISQQLNIWTLYQKTSKIYNNHGILATNFYYSFKPNLNIGFSIGKDDERIRDFIQNKLIHQSKWLAKINPTVKQKVIPIIERKSRWLFQLGWNDKFGY
jgi:Bacterial toxin 23